MAAGQQPGSSKHHLGAAELQGQLWAGQHLLDGDIHQASGVVNTQEWHNAG